MTIKKPVKVLFVCMGNICRSPTAEGVFRNLIEQKGLIDRVSIDSAGTHAYHVGEQPDRRAQAAARKRNIDLSTLRGRKFICSDFHDFDYVLAMDNANLRDMQFQDSGEGNARLSLFLEFATSHLQKEVPDPYYGGTNGFERVLDMIEDASAGLLESIRKDHDL